VPDAEPRLEPLRSGGPNKPYEVLGERYTPMTARTSPGAKAAWPRGTAASSTAGPRPLGETYDMYAMTAAHKTLPLPSYARVRNPANGREIVVRINDRGPFHGDRIVDLSYTAALKLGVLGGVAPVVLERITFDEIRSGQWRRDRDAPAPLRSTPPPQPTDDPLRDFLDRRGDPGRPALTDADRGSGLQQLLHRRLDLLRRGPHGQPGGVVGRLRMSGSTSAVSIHSPLALRKPTCGMPKYIAGSCSVSHHTAVPVPATGMPSSLPMPRKR
jgi:hypothetical protein